MIVKIGHLAMELRNYHQSKEDCPQLNKALAPISLYLLMLLWRKGLIACMLLHIFNGRLIQGFQAALILDRIEGINVS